MPHREDVSTYPPSCFKINNTFFSNDLLLSTAITLDTPAAEALAVLLPMLGCGEEAAALAFDGLARFVTNEHARDVMLSIAIEERVHDVLLKNLGQALPSVGGAHDIVRKTRRFHIDLGRGGVVLHLARIAAIDAAVCTLLSRLLRTGTPLSADPVVHGIFARIRTDESRHVRLSRDIVLAAGAPPIVRDAAAAARGALAHILMLGSDSFETLAVDPDALFRDVYCLPNGLLAA